MSNNNDKDRNWLGHSDQGTSPIVIVAMAAAKVTLYGLAFLVVIVLGIFLWQKSKDALPMANGDWGMVAVLAVLAFLCAFMGRKITSLLTSVR